MNQPNIQYADFTPEQAPLDNVRLQVLAAFKLIRDGEMTLRDISKAGLFPPDWTFRLGLSLAAEPVRVWWITLPQFRSYSHGHNKPLLHLTADKRRTLCGERIPYYDKTIRIRPAVHVSNRCRHCYTARRNGGGEA